MQKLIATTFVFVCLAQPAQVAYSQDCSVLVQQGYAQMRAGNPGNAMQTLTQAVRLNPTNVEARRYLGVAMIQCGLNANAVEQLDYVVRSANPLAIDYGYLGQAQSLCGKLDMALGSYQQAVKLDPS